MNEHVLTVLKVEGRVCCWSKWVMGRDSQGSDPGVKVRNVNFILKVLRSHQKVLIKGVA